MMMKKKFALALLASLALNLFLLGLVAQRFVGHHRDRGAVHPHSDHRKKSPPQDLLLLRRMVQVMGGREDPRVKALWSGSRSEMRAVRKEMGQARRTVHQALTKDPFDEAELALALSALRDKSNAAQEGAQEGVMALAELLTPEEREALRKLPPPGRRKGHRQKRK